MVARLISVNEDTELSDLHDVFQQVLGWGGDLGFQSFPKMVRISFDYTNQLVYMFS